MTGFPAPPTSATALVRHRLPGRSLKKDFATSIYSDLWLPPRVGTTKDEYYTMMNNVYRQRRSRASSAFFPVFTPPIAKKAVTILNFSPTEKSRSISYNVGKSTNSRKNRIFGLPRLPILPIPHPYEHISAFSQ